MIWPVLRDLVWPMLDGPEEQLQSPPAWDGTHAVARHALDELIAADDERRKSADTRLQGLLILASLTATLLMGFVVFVTQNTKTYASWSAQCIILAGAYIILQCIRTLWASTAGLTTRTYQQLTTGTLGPKAGETNEAGEATATYHARVTKEKLACYAHNMWATNTKLSQLNLAYRALQNVLGMLFVLAIALALIAMANVITPPR